MSRRRLSLPLLSCLVLALVAVSSGPALAAPDPTAVTINEVKTNPGTDFVELRNTGSEAIDITGWTALDNNVKSVPLVIAPAGTIIPPGGLYSFEPDVTGGFGLGADDSITITANGTQIATYAWTTHRALASYGLCPGSTQMVLLPSATPGAANDCSPPDPTRIRINEVRSSDAANGPDFVELINTGSQPIDITGWKADDSGATQEPFVFAPAGTTIAPGGYFSFDTAADPAGFGLGGTDSVSILRADGTTVIDTYSWTAHRTPSSGRCPAGTGAFVVNATATPGTVNVCPLPAGAADLRINEVESEPNDKIELVNLGTQSLDISGYVLRDNGAASLFTIPAGTTIGAGGYQVLDVNPAFGLGKGDSARLYAPGGETLIDSTTWPADTHAQNWGRCADGTGAFRTVKPTLGSVNDCTVADPSTVIKINEVESNGDTVGDWVELTNTGTTTVDISGWRLLDNDPSHATTPVVVPAGTTIAPGAFSAIYTEHNQTPGFGLGNPDSVTLFLADGTTTVDTYAWDTHAATTYGRCPDGTGSFTTTAIATRAAANDCGPGTTPNPGTGPTTTSWPGSPDVRTSDLATTFVQDLSGLAFDPKDPDVLWAAQNKLGTLFKLVRSGQNWVPDTTNSWGVGKTPKYKDGTGAPDTEGLTIGPDGFIYAASERNNDANKISRMSILRYDPSATGTTLTATDEWDLTGTIPAAGANLGLEGTTWVPDTFLTNGGFIDQSTKAAYRPSDYPLHGTGLYAVAVEATGAVHLFALDSAGGTSHLIATVASGFPNLADVTFDPERQRLWAVTDDTHDGRTSLLELRSGAFVVAEAYDRPTGMPNINNEGLAISPQSTCVAGSKEVVWASDGDDNGHSLRSGTISCTAVPGTEPPVSLPPATQPPVTDTTAPYVRIAGVTGNRLYTGSAPTARCISTDAGSGVASCTIARQVTATRTTLTATAVDRAGNVGSRMTSYRTLAYRADRATYRGGKFLLERGTAYRLVGTVATSGRVHGPARLGTVAKPSTRLRNGTATVRIPRSAVVGSTWKIIVKSGSTSHTIKVKVTR